MLAESNHEKVAFIRAQSCQPNTVLRAAYLDFLPCSLNVQNQWVLQSLAVQKSMVSLAGAASVEAV